VPFHDTRGLPAARCAALVCARLIARALHGPAQRAGLAVLLAAPIAACGDGDRLPATFASSVTIISICGDAEIDGDEECDDGNAQPGDGCSIFCELERDASAPLEDGAPDAGEGSDAADESEDSATANADAPRGEDAVAAADAGTGSADAAPRELMCSAAPADACEACHCAMCRPQLEVCAELVGSANEGSARGTPRAELCETLVRCSVAAGCRSIACVCEAASTVTCLEGSTAPDGPCQAEALAAAETSDVLTMLLRASMRDTGYAIAAASAVSTCSAHACADTCAP
jgi:cysteine-rich repeat protein